MQISHTGIQSRLQNSKSLQMQSRAAEVARLSKNHKDKDKLKEVCYDFEAIFLNKMFKQMRKASKLGGKPLLDGGMSEEIFKDMLFDEYAKQTARSNGIGIADMLYQYLDQTQNIRPRGSA